MSIRVLLAGGNEISRKAIRNLLERAPEIQLVAEGDTFIQAMQIIGKLRPRVFVMDLYMGDQRDVTALSATSGLVGPRLLVIPLWNDDEPKSLADNFDRVQLLNKAKLATELIPAVKSAHHKQMNLRREDGEQATLARKSPRFLPSANLKVSS
jgi:DNA-binding NarL/FixJ family response regulator